VPTPLQRYPLAGVSTGRLLRRAFGAAVVFGAGWVRLRRAVFFGVPSATVADCRGEDVTQTLALVDAVTAVAGRVGHPHKRREAVLGDKGYESQAVRRELRHRGAAASCPSSPDAATQTSTVWAMLRYVVEQIVALLHQFKRPAVRWERRLDLHNAFVSLGCTLICWRRLKKATT